MSLEIKNTVNWNIKTQKSDHRRVYKTPKINQDVYDNVLDSLDLIDPESLGIGVNNTEPQAKQQKEVIEVLSSPELADCEDEKEETKQDKEKEKEEAKQDKEKEKEKPKKHHKPKKKSVSGGCILVLKNCRGIFKIESPDPMSTEESESSEAEFSDVEIISEYVAVPLKRTKLKLPKHQHHR